jgi:predicted nucleic acid-binding protein
VSRGFLLDTNIPSELIRSQPEPRVESWLSVQSESSLFLSVVSIGELYKGIALLPPSKRRSALEDWFHNDLLVRFADRILPITYAIAERWGTLEARCQQNGIALKTADGMIAATALVHDLTVATRDADFAKLGVPVINPWQIP